jgi:uncharacterized protein (TIGR01777 family)
MGLFVILRTNSVAFRAAAKQQGRSSNNNKNNLSSASNNFTKSFSAMASACSSINDETTTSSSNKYYTIGITGASGLIGTALRDELSKKGTWKDGKEIRTVLLTRGSQAESLSKKELGDDDASSSTSLVWNPNGSTATDVIDPIALEEMDAVIHLSGENISTGLSGPLAPLGIRPWTDAKKKEILDSRTITTSALAKAIGNTKKNKNIDFLVASGVGAYGNHYMEGGETAAAAAAADESYDISNSKGFLAEVSRQWEDSAAGANKNNGCRTAILRNGVVLSKQGGAMAKLYPIFFMGGGGIVGSGKQYFPYISARDMARAMIHVLETPSLEGPVNMVSPGAATNADFTKAMGSVMRRPTLLPFPSFAVKLMFGEMGEEILLGGTRAEPKKLLESGFQFLHPTVDEAVKSAVDESI